MWLQYFSNPLGGSHCFDTPRQGISALLLLGMSDRGKGIAFCPFGSPQSSSKLGTGSGPPSIGIVLLLFQGGEVSKKAIQSGDRTANISEAFVISSPEVLEYRKTFFLLVASDSGLTG